MSKSCPVLFACSLVLDHLEKLYLLNQPSFQSWGNYWSPFKTIYHHHYGELKWKPYQLQAFIWDSTCFSTLVPICLVGMVKINVTAEVTGNRTMYGFVCTDCLSICLQSVTELLKYQTSQDGDLPTVCLKTDC